MTRASGKTGRQRPSAEEAIIMEDIQSALSQATERLMGLLVRL